MKKIRLYILIFVFLFAGYGCEFGSIHDNSNGFLHYFSQRQLKYQEQMILSQNSLKKYTMDTKEVIRLIDYPTFMDATGFFTTIKYRPKRVAILFSSYAQTWELAGGKVSITVQETVDRKLLKDNRVAIVGQGSGKDIKLESLLAYEPDFVVLTAEYSSHLELAEILRLYEIPVLVLRVDSFFDYLKMLEIFTTILNTQDCYRQFGNEVFNRIDSILEITDAIIEKPSVLFLRAYSYGAKVKTTNHFVGQMLDELGAINIAEANPIKSDTISLEALLTSKIDHIFISVMGDDEEAVRQYIENELFKLPGYCSLDAVINHKYTILPKDLFSYKPNQNWDQAYEYLAKTLYPDYFQ